MNVAEYERSLHLPKNYNVIKKGFINFDSWEPRYVCVCVCVWEREKQAEKEKERILFRKG